MSAANSKVRLYDLAKELKIDTKRLIDEVRREGVSASVPSNQISKVVAERIRDRLRPKVIPALKDEPVSLTFRPFASLLSDVEEVESAVPSSTQNPLKQLIPVLSNPAKTVKPAKTYNATAKKPAQKAGTRVRSKPKKTAPLPTKDCPKCGMSFPLQIEMRNHLFSVHGYVLTRFGLAKASLGLLNQPSKIPKAKKHKAVVKSKPQLVTRAKPPQESAGTINENTLAMLHQMSFVQLRTRILHNLKTRRWDVPPDEYLRLLNSRTTVTYGIDLAGRRLFRIEVLPAMKRSGLSFRPKRLNWRLLPPGTDCFSSILQYYEQLSKSYPEVGYDLERLHKAYSLQPHETYVGLDEFQGYVVFYFQNSRTAVLDCPVTGNAIYVFGENWKNLARLTKAELLNRRRSELERIIHRGSWFVRLKATVRRRTRERGRAQVSSQKR